MPSLFRATVGLDQESWGWHHRNPGQLSRLAKERVALEIALDSLPDIFRDHAAKDAAQAFFDRYSLQGEYAICNDHIVRHAATDEQMAADAKALFIPVERLMPLLDELYALELEFQLRTRCIFAEMGNEKGAVR